MLKSCVASFYTANVPEVAAAQREVLGKFTPPEFKIEQIVMTNDYHGGNIDAWMPNNDYELIVILDIDCVPLHAKAIPELAEHATRGELAGAAHRSVHIQNNNHLYIGAFCIAFTRDLWEFLDRPLFHTTLRGDTAEELTYAAEEKNVPLHMMWPTSCEIEMEDLANGVRFGRNTVYDNAFMHTGAGARAPWLRPHFVLTCQKILSQT